MKRLMQFMEDDVPAVLMAVMVIVLSAEVFSRYLLGHSIVGASEIAQICFIWQVYLAIAVGAFQGAVQPSISAMNSRAVDARSQGELQGAVQSIGSIAQIIGPPLYAQTLARFSGPGALIDLPTMPMLVASVIALAALVLFLKGARRTA